ncbi:tyrosine-type recombinase/integrase [Methylobacterium durans]|uniref:tyrosine-type recombinase/integrase n=1 Tax=Methylobacterium durans TaxID=2202825 RepID=UPI002B003935|nr:tyrosine-type recombinase/integrase [Methylobacterium durans]MEA1835170.1 tyrosine-type recombinase/integrase [Methylobacterium durans]
MTALAQFVDGTLGAPLDLDRLADRAAGLAEGARAPATRRAYRSDWRQFEAWCAGHGLSALPAEPATIGLYLAAHEAVLSVATLTRRLASVSVAHRMAGHHLDTRHPAIRDVMSGLRRARGTAQRRAEALTVPLARRLLAGCGERLIDARDRALLLVGLGAALRRSELVALELTDVALLPEGLRLTIRRSKGDQEGEGQLVAVGRTGTATCPAAALEAWLAAAGIGEGRVFRGIDRHGRVGEALSDRAVALIVQRRAAAAGLDAKAFAGHSLRAGFATSAAAHGVEERVIAKTTRHRSSAILRRYIREGELFERNVAGEIGL